RGADGRIRRSRHSHAEFLQRLAEPDVEPVPAVHEQQAVSTVHEEHVVQQGWPGGSIDTSLLT
ncbi:hypothetical protein A2U01_0087631, partial [Trifolium medium]|nr:hypothetical protein [Trifolium medium]